MKRFILAALVLSVSLFLSACGTGAGYGTAQQPPDSLAQEQAGPPAPDAMQSAPVQPVNLRPVKVGILLPLSGEHQQLGQSMLKAAQMALFEVGYEGFELIPRDTKNTPQQAADAARSAIADGAELLLGPVFSESVAAVKPVAQQAGINVISFTTDWKQAGGNSFIMGFLPFDQINRVVRYAAAQNIRSAGALIPNSDYGQIALSAYEQMASHAGIQTTDVERFNTMNKDLSPVLRRFSRYDERHPPNQPPLNALPYEAVFMPVGGDTAKIIGNMLTQLDLPPSRVRRLGTGLFDDESLTQEPGLEGAWFAAPDPNSRQAFERRFLQNYGYSAPRLATLAYDATALAAVLAKRGLSSPENKPAFARADLMNPNGFAGIDGIFRFRPDGTAERGLAVLEIRRGKIGVIEPAPKSFQAYSSY